MMSIDLIAKNILEYMIDLERFGWPPTCTKYSLSAERPLELYDKNRPPKYQRNPNKKQ